MPQAQKRRPRTRSFGGCLTCRVRKVKCGQERPTCANCNRLEVACRGYSSKLHWIVVHPEEGIERETVCDVDTSLPHACNTRHDRMRGNLFTVKERKDMAIQMSAPFSGQNLEEGLARCINDLERLRMRSKSAVIGPFGVFDVGEVIIGQFDLGANVHLPEDESPLLDWVTQASSHLEVSDLNQVLDLPTQLELRSWPEYSPLRHSTVATASTLALSASKPPLLPEYELSFLLNHFSSHLEHLLYPMPQANTPWNINLSKALVGSKQYEQTSSAHLSHLYGILAMSAFHADRIYNGRGSSKRGTVTEKPSSEGLYSCGTKYEKLAYEHIQAFSETSRDMEGHAGTDFTALVALVSLLAVKTIAGEENPGRLLIPCRNLPPRRHNFSASFTKNEMAILRCTAIYLGVIARSVCIPTRDPPFRVPDIPRRHHNGNCDKSEPRGADITEENALDDEECQVFNSLYGFPYSLLLLIAETTTMAAEIEKLISENSYLAPSSPLHSRVLDLEARVLAEGARIQCTSQGLETDIASLSCSISEVVCNALIVYFFRSVRTTNPAILQHYVANIFTRLADQECIKLEHELDCGILLWPLYIAGCEAVGEKNRKAAIDCLRRAGDCGFRTTDTAEIVFRELWKRRDTCNEDIAFQAVLQDVGLQISLL